MSEITERVERVYTKMATMRAFDERVQQLSADKQIPGYAHVYLGSEAIAAGVMEAIDSEDMIASTYRSHGHAIAKDVDLFQMAAELFGRRSGVCKGKGGSMHISDFNKGMLGAFGIVAAGIPVALGAALSASMQKNGKLGVAFFGDGAVHQGVFHEGMGLAKLWNAPLLLVCENNGYAEATSVDYHLNTKTIADMACAYDMPSLRCDGMDVEAVYNSAQEAVDRARSDGGPTLIECVSYRFAGQFEGDSHKYQPEKEWRGAKTRDPLLVARNTAISNGIIESTLDEIDEEVRKKVDEAFISAGEEPWPAPEDTLEDVYVSY